MLVEIRPEAYEDLLLIEDWCCYQFGEEVGVQVRESILSKLDHLSTFPDIGKIINDKELAEQGYRAISMDAFCEQLKQ